MSSNPSLYGQCLRCQSCLSDILGILRAVESNKADNALVEDLRGRFRVWADNVGARRPPESTTSLDHRLRDARVMRESIRSGLSRLETLAATIMELTNSSTTNPAGPDQGYKISSSENEYSDERKLGELLLSLKASVDHLFSLSVLLRRHRPRGRVGNFTSEVVDASPYITNVIDKHSKLKKTPWLAERLGVAAAKRRSFILYRQAHRRHLTSQHGDAENRDAKKSLLHNGTESAIATTYLEIVPSSVIEELDGHEEILAHGSASIHTAATSFVSLGDEGSMGRKIPELSDLVLDGQRLEYGRHFECPYCRTIQIVHDLYEWREHVFSDLQPYVCTFDGCDDGDKLFTRRTDWFQHEVESHYRLWVCVLCHVAPKSYTKAVDFREHLTTSHREVANDKQRDLLIRACETPLQSFQADNCPLCSDWAPAHVRNNAKEFRRHLARHLQQLALEALPLAIEGLEEWDSSNKDPQPIFMLPWSRNPHFVKPELTFANILHKLFQTTHDGSEFLVQRQAPPPKPSKWLILWGDAGVGKTEIAKEICFWSQENQPARSVFWLNAANRTTALNGCESILSSIGRLEAAVDETHIISMLRAYLSDESASGEWLLVLDDADFATFDYYYYHLPVNDNGKVLMTMRLPIPTLPEDEFTVINVVSLSLLEARLLLRRTGACQDWSGQEVDELLQHSLGSPLAITRVGAFIRNSNMTFTEFFRRFNEMPE